MKSVENIKLNKNSNIQEALEVINRGAMQIALVVDNNDKLIATLTDGDIRRALLSGKTLDSSISNIAFSYPTVVRDTDTKEKVISLSLLKKLNQIPVVDKNDMLIGIIDIKEFFESQNKTNKVVLMLGGLGTRLRPLTENTPKPMLKVGDKPILETIILSFKKQGFKNFVFSLGYKADIIKEYFQNGEKFGVDIEYVIEEKRMGTAGALSLIKEKITEDFFVMNGDLLTNMNFCDMMDYHLRNNSLATMGVREYEFQVPYGVVNVDGIKIKNIDEKPIHNFFVSAGIYCLSEKILSFIPEDQFYDMPSLFEKLISENLKSISYPINEYWLDIGRIKEYKKANEEYEEVFNK